MGRRPWNTCQKQSFPIDFAPRNSCAVRKGMGPGAVHLPSLFGSVGFYPEFAGGKHPKRPSSDSQSNSMFNLNQWAPSNQPLSLHPASTNKNAARAFHGCRGRSKLVPDFTPRGQEIPSFGILPGKPPYSFIGDPVDFLSNQASWAFWTQKEHLLRNRSLKIWISLLCLHCPTITDSFEEQVCSQGFCTAHQYGLWDAGQDRDEGSQGCRNAAWIVRYCQSVNPKPVATQSQTMGQGCRLQATYSMATRWIVADVHQLANYSTNFPGKTSVSSHHRSQGTGNQNQCNCQALRNVVYLTSQSAAGGSGKSATAPQIRMIWMIWQMSVVLIFCWLSTYVILFPHKQMAESSSSRPQQGWHGDLWSQSFQHQPSKVIAASSSEM